MVFISLLIFLIGIEAYKAAKRLFYRRRSQPKSSVINSGRTGEVDVEKVAHGNEAEKAVRI